MLDLIPTPKHKDLIYDVGMHHGEDTEFYLRKGFRVVAFEADPDKGQALSASVYTSCRTGLV
jgi:16S rRNA A1518/A1519 N6-dimethyltransferase RsmA/KsgA/DIM1 with predicted DNA glycosylase/AP lyase activity